MRLGAATSRAGKIPLLVPSLLPLLLLLCVGVLRCETDGVKSPASKAVSAQLVAGINDLARTLGAQLGASGDSEKTEIFSPVSIGTMLFLLLRLSNKQLRSELHEILHLDGNATSHIGQNFAGLINELTTDIAGKGVLDELPGWHSKRNCYLSEEDDYDPEYDDGVYLPEPILPNVVRVANGLFVQDGLIKNDTEMVKLASDLYKARIERVNFQKQPHVARTTINRWVNESTHGRIEQILTDNLPPSTLMVLASALYFKATWETFFNDPQYSRPQPFFPDGEGKPSVQVQVPAMFTAGCYPYYASPELDASIMAFPYRNRTTSMYIILPNGSNREKVRALRAKLGSAELDQLIGQMKHEKAIVVVPRMHITNRYNLRESLEQLGLKSLFDPSKKSLSLGTKRSKKLFVESMVHQINLDVNEQGTEGGAVTMGLMERSMPPVHFRVRTPFLLAIRHDPTKMLLFYGAVYDPS